MFDLVKEKMDAYNELLDENLERKKNFEEKYSKEK